MALELFNTLSRKKESFKPLNPPNVGLYTCGPTVYNHPHIGNYRAYIFGDILKRYLIYSGYQVNHIMNITDIDDKTIFNSQKENKSLKEFTEFYTKIFFEEIKSLNIIEANKYPKATEYVKEILLLIKDLLFKEYAYLTEDGSVYFNIKKFKEYGKLSHFKIDDLKKNAKGRLNQDEYEKENAEDFALWKAWDESDGEIFWKPQEIIDEDLGLSNGRPGWHIECSAMSLKELGNSFDIHTGGVDNIFPHHENEIAQSECSTGKPFAKYFLHNEHLLVDGSKMSKSLGNFYTLEDLKKEDIDPIAFRLWLYTSHYRTKTNFTLDAVRGSQIALSKIRENYLDLGEDVGEINTIYKNKLISFMDNDLDTPQALAILWSLLKDEKIKKEDKKATLLDFDKIFGLGLGKLKKEIIPENIKSLIKEREDARERKDWSLSDQIRDKVKNLGYEIKDTDSGQKISKQK
ncbi:MAG: cysteine--tRNA ligase [Candidatus Pacebacteria bacterium]|nr:cysteine--tRNA ligase [Candidatus Paceibacterota bacterium]